MCLLSIVVLRIPVNFAISTTIKINKLVYKTHCIAQQVLWKTLFICINQQLHVRVSSLGNLQLSIIYSYYAAPSPKGQICYNDWSTGDGLTSFLKRKITGQCGGSSWWTTNRISTISEGHSLYYILKIYASGLDLCCQFQKRVLAKLHLLSRHRPVWRTQRDFVYSPATALANWWSVLDDGWQVYIERRMRRSFTWLCG